MFKHALTLCMALAVVSSASATTVLFKLTILGTGSGVSTASNDSPVLRIENQSRVPATLTKFRLTIGDTSKNFDRTAVVSSLGASTRVRVTPNDNLNGDSRSDVLEWNFTGLDPNERVDLGSEIDPDSTNGALDYRTVFFNNGGGLSNNSVLTVHFLQAGVSRIQSFTLPDQTPGQTSYIFSTPVPEPGTMATLGLGLLTIMISRFGR